MPPPKSRLDCQSWERSEALALALKGGKSELKDLIAHIEFLNERGAPLESLEMLNYCFDMTAFRCQLSDTHTPL